MDEEQRNQRIGAAVIGTGQFVWFVVWLAVTVLIVAASLPVAREHCTAGGGAELSTVESGWRFGIPPWLFDDKPVDDNASYCVRTSLSRELLSAVGVWPLGDPEDQVNDSLVQSASEAAPKAGDYVSEMLRLRKKSEEDGLAFREQLQQAQSPAEAASAFREISASQNSVADTLRALNPPPQMEEYNQAAISLNQRSADAAADVADTIENRTTPEVQAAIADYDALQRQLTRELTELSGGAP